jgi:hypothetical protein
MEIFTLVVLGVCFIVGLIDYVSAHNETMLMALLTVVAGIASFKRSKKGS